MLKGFIVKLMLNKLFKQFFDKTKLSTLPQGATTLGLGGLLIAAGTWLQAHPEIIAAIFPGNEGWILALLGAVFMFLRTRGLLKGEGEDTPQNK